MTAGAAATAATSTAVDEWTVVTAADKKRVMRKRGAGKSTRRPAYYASDDFTASTTVKDLAVLERCLEECIAYLLQTCFWKNLVEALAQDNINNINIGQIVCYGIGNISQTSTTYFAPSLWQLACAVAVQRHFDVTAQEHHSPPPPPPPMMMRLYDPCASAVEIHFVRQVLLMTVPEENERGSYPVASSTLFFMPHCPARLYENVVWSNYQNDGNDVWILGNSLRRIAETNHCPCLQTIMECDAMVEFNMEPTRRECDEAPGNLMAAFNDTYLTRLPRRSRPPRPYDQLLPLEENGELI